MMRQRGFRNLFIAAAALGAVVGGGRAAAQPPVSLPVPDDLPPCERRAPAATQAAVVFPCGVIVTSRTGQSTDELAKIVGSAGGQHRFSYRSANAAAAVIRDHAALQRLSDRNDVDVIPDRKVTLSAKPSAAVGPSATTTSTQTIPAGVRRIGAAPGVLSYTGAGVGVAIVDTGIALHSDLSLGAKCFDAFGGNCRDGNGHGTHVAGIVAALNNSSGVVGVAPGAKLYAVRVLNNAGSGSDSTVMAGLQWIIDNANVVTPRIKVANLSLGRPGSLNDNPAMRALFQTIRTMGISVAVAAGNDPYTEVSQQVPATYPDVMAVASATALNGSNQCVYFSGVIGADTASYFTTDGAMNGYNIGVTLSAPGEDRENITSACTISSVGILSLSRKGGTTRMSGSSMASPHVAGVLALMVQANGGTLNPDTARVQLRSTAFRIGAAPLDSPSGAYTFDGEREGVVSACFAVGAACP